MLRMHIPHRLVSLSRRQSPTAFSGTGGMLGGGQSSPRRLLQHGGMCTGTWIERSATAKSVRYGAAQAVSLSRPTAHLDMSLVACLFRRARSHDGRGALCGTSWHVAARRLAAFALQHARAGEG